MLHLLFDWLMAAWCVALTIGLYTQGKKAERKQRQINNIFDRLETLRKGDLDLMEGFSRFMEELRAAFPK